MRLLMLGGCLLVAAVFGGAIRRNHERRSGWMCRLRGGHNDVLLFGENHIRARCMDCNRVTPGWNLAIGARRAAEGSRLMPLWLLAVAVVVGVMAIVCTAMLWQEFRQRWDAAMEEERKKAEWRDRQERRKQRRAEGRIDRRAER